MTKATALPNESVGNAVSAGDAFQNAHVVEKGDPRVDGPYLDDIRAAQEDEYRRQRNKNISQVRDEDTNKKKDVPFDDFRAASQVQHDENRYREEKTVKQSLKAERKKTPKTKTEKAGKGDTPNLKVAQKKASKKTSVAGPKAEKGASKKTAAKKAATSRVSAQEQAAVKPLPTPGQKGK